MAHPKMVSTAAGPVLAPMIADLVPSSLWYTSAPRRISILPGVWKLGSAKLSWVDLR